MKCDQERPSCGQCARSGFLCEGYDKARIFINSSQKHGGVNKYSFTPKPYSARNIKKLVQDQAALTSQVNRLILDPSLERTAVDLKYFGLYWSSFLPNGKAFTPQAGRYSTTGWTAVVQNLCQLDDGVRLALLTNALGLAGQESGQRSLILEGWRMYTRSLQTLAKSISTVGQRKPDMLLAAASLLAGYEVNLKSPLQSEQTTY